MNNIESAKGEIVMYQPDETIRLEVRVEDETVWLTQQQMAELFLTTKQNVSLHINNIYDERELEEAATVKDYLTIRKEGNRTVKRHVKLYNLDVIISVDNYINVDTLTMLSNRDTNVSATIYTRQLSQQQQLDLQRHNQQYPPIAINTCQHNHDRFLIVDDVVYLFGASLKDAGKKLFAYIKMQETSPQELLSNIQ